MALTVIAKSIDFALVKSGRFKIGEKRLRGRPGEPDTRTKEEGRETYSGILPEALQDALEIGLALRGVNWDFGRDIYIPPTARPQDRAALLKSVSSSLWRNILILDFYDSIIKSVPGVGSPTGGSIFFSSLPSVPRFAISTVIHILTGMFLILGLECSYDIASLVGVGLLNQPPWSWPGFMDHPWRSESLHELWAKRWHQSLKQVFMIYGGYPGKWVAGNVGMVLGTFLASGLLHELSTYVIDRPLDHRVTLFFFLQGVGVVLESVWRKITGCRVGGWCGRLWVLFFMLVLGQICSAYYFICNTPNFWLIIVSWMRMIADAWAIRGIGGSVIIPSYLSPTRLLLFPALRYTIAMFNS